ncbi:MAG: flagellar motor protein MotD [Gammaproteobacteria bacterium]|nr:MAG: flagellar motor protein MotD [Gammaproteobacteria bacterium]
MARRKKAEEHENLERWLVSYADFITLLFAFFVVMYAVSSVNEGKYRVLAESLMAAFRAPTKSLEPIQVGTMVRSPYESQSNTLKSPTQAVPVPIPLNVPMPKLDLPLKPVVRAPMLSPGMSKRLSEMAQKIQAAMKELVGKGLIKVRGNAFWVEVEIKDRILFPSGSAELAPKALPVLEQIAEILKRFPNPIQVEGHTDNRPIHTRIFPSNWELSAARAASVVRFFVEKGIAPERLAAVGYGEYRPVADNSTPEGRQQNRRVVLVILANLEMERAMAIHRTPLRKE